MIVVYALLLWQRKRVNASLIQFGPRIRTTFNILLVVFSTLLALEIMAIRIYALLYLLCTIVLFLASLVLESPAAAPLLPLRRASFILILCLTVTWLSQASVAATLLFARGEVFIRTMTAGPVLMIISGLVWGAVLGYWVHGFLRFPRPKRRLESVIKFGLVMVILVFGVGNGSQPG